MSWKTCACMRAGDGVALPRATDKGGCVRPFDQLPETERAERYTRLARKALDAYGLIDAEITRQEGTRDAVFHVSKSDERGTRTYALRIGHTDRSIEQLRREIVWLVELCREAKLIVPEPILAPDGDLIHRVGIAGVPGFRSCVLLRWVRGWPLDSDPKPDTMRRAGSFVATLHRHGATYRWPEELATLRPSFAEIEKRISLVALTRYVDRTEVETFEQAIERIQNELDDLGEGSDVVGVVHQDLTLDRLRIDGDQIGAVGFDRCGWGYFAADIARLFVGLRGRNEAETLRAAFLDGYRGIHPVADGTIDRLPVFDALRAVDDIAEVLALDHERLLSDPAGLLERPLSILKRFAAS